MELIKSELEKTIKSDRPVSLTERMLLPGTINIIDVRYDKESLTLIVLSLGPTKIRQNQAFDSHVLSIQPVNMVPPRKEPII